MNNSTSRVSSEPNINMRDNNSKDKPETILTILKEFCGYTTSGGLGRVVGSKYFVFKLLWAVVFFGALSAAVSQLVPLFKTFRRKPISTRISLEHSPKLNFPSVTFCNFNIIRKSQLRNLPESLRRSIEEYNDKSNVSAKGKNDNATYHSLDDDDEGYVDPDSLDEAHKAAEKVSVLMAEVDWKKLEPFGHQFRVMIRKCKYKGVNCRNREAFQRYWSSFWHYKFGNCYMFNPETIDGTLQKGLTASKPGPLHGLTVELDAEQNEYINQLTEDAGIVTQIIPRGKMPFPYEEGLSLAPGFSTSLGMRRVHISRIDPFKNNSCADKTIGSNNDMYTKKYNVSYSKTACLLSCIAHNQKKKCGCMEYKFNPDDKIVCDSLNRTTVICLRTVIKMARNNSLNCTARCPPPCNEVLFKTATSFSSWPSSEFQRFLSLERNEENRNYSESGGLSKNLLKVQIFYQELNYEKIQEEVSYGLENFLADIGGVLGLWMGVSVLTGAEVVELIALIIIHFCNRNNKNITKTEETAMEEGSFGRSGNHYNNEFKRN